jgi:hypothetical protein
MTFWQRLRPALTTGVYCAIGIAVMQGLAYYFFDDKFDARFIIWVSIGVAVGHMSGSKWHPHRAAARRGGADQQLAGLRHR